MSCFTRARERSDSGIAALRELAVGVFGSGTGLVIGTNGSYARREATAGSDVDLFYLLCEDEEFKSETRREFEDRVTKAGFKLPSGGGVFSDALRTEELLRNIGGLDDTNVSLTRRLLLLLEGDWLFNKEGYLKVRKELLARYITEKTPKDKIALFLLNDIIRYWRTICVDYEYKTGDGGKPRGIRLVKLRFSRMFLVFGGIIAIAETFGLDYEQKLRRLEELLSLDVLKRVEDILGARAERAVALYGEFLEALESDALRERLSSRDYEETIEFAQLRTKGREFKDHLLKLLAEHYSETHPIHKALLL